MNITPTEARRSAAFMLRLSPYPSFPCTCTMASDDPRCAAHHPDLAPSEVKAEALEAFALGAARVLAEEYVDASCCAGRDDAGRVVVAVLGSTKADLDGVHALKRQYGGFTIGTIVEFTLRRGGATPDPGIRGRAEGGSSAP